MPNFLVAPARRVYRKYWSVKVQKQVLPLIFCGSFLQRGYMHHFGRTLSTFKAQVEALLIGFFKHAQMAWLQISGQFKKKTCHALQLLEWLHVGMGQVLMAHIDIPSLFCCVLLVVVRNEVFWFVQSWDYVSGNDRDDVIIMLGELYNVQDGGFCACKHSGLILVTHFPSDVEDAIKI